MPEFRELYDYTYVSEPNIGIFPHMNPGDNRQSMQVFQGYVSVDGSTIVANTNFQLTRTRQTSVFDLVESAGPIYDGVKILMPGTYEIVFEITSTGSHQVEIYESSLGPTSLAISPVVAATDRTRLTAILRDLTITPADPAIIRFRAASQATSNGTTAAASLVLIRSLGDVIAL